MTMLSKCSEIHVLPKSATVKCQEIFERTYRSYNRNLFIFIIMSFFFKLQYHSHITKIQSYVSLNLGNVQLAVRLTT